MYMYLVSYINVRYWGMHHILALSIQGKFEVIRLLVSFGSE